MKKLIYLLNLIIVISVLSCGQNSYEKQLNGKWYEIESEKSILHFYPDSLILVADLKNIVEWSATKEKIEFEYPTHYIDSQGKPNDTKDKIIINYKLSDTKDSLYGTLKNRFGIHKFGLLKAENYVEYLNKKYGVEFSLSKNHNAEVIKFREDYGLKIFAGILDNEVYGKTELSKTLNDLDSDIKKFKGTIKPNERPEIDTLDQFYDYRFHLRVFADKNISDSVLLKKLPTKLLGSKGDSILLKIYRMYENTEKYDLDILKGKKIKTIADTI